MLREQGVIQHMNNSKVEQVAHQLDDSIRSLVKRVEKVETNNLKFQESVGAQLSELTSLLKQSREERNEAPAAEARPPGKL